MENVVILDLGSNSTRLSINEVTNGSFREVRRQKVMTRMAEGMGKTLGEKVLKKAAIERTLAALADFKKEYQDLPNLKVKGIATAAVRAASNSQAFLNQVKELTGVDVEVLSGDAEAYYDYVGVKNSLKLNDFILCDMGGGSFELAVVKDGQAVNLASIPFGAVSLTERFNAQDLLSAKDLFRFQGFVQGLFNEQLWLLEGRYLPLVLLGGANRTVARTEMMRRGQKNLDEFHGVKMSARSFLNIYTDWLGLNFSQRRERLGVEADRADIILGGLTPIAQLIQQLDIPELIFSESGVREGILYSMVTE
ncbi:Ppx/GppA family phosphatase [Ligilactobacillus agilis]|uniref:Exopolyphosphatase n=1 Tax=Ligilactobacillus agilis TaxID=1601 RepID=A0A6F9XWA0_9LACO|nr:Ppx/GppA family phosphatase [Ligilactobacillus agilis]UNL41863.1 Ppx/GppA family phosphatase [Ligilactobacillus agilis]UNL58762.1 Ppx/GppA family phosphatase [Ligilactobacillus agilis]GET09445.1 exopolyphosphatase [Ligilactobacillus agilis]